MSHKYFLLSNDRRLKHKYLIYMLVPILRLVKNFSMKANRILSFTLFTFNIVWRKHGGGGAPTSWLIGPLVIDLAPIGCTSCSATNLTIWTPTHTLCMLHQSTWLSAQLLAPARWVECMCIVLGTVPNGNWVIPTWSAWVVASWGAISNGDWVGGRKLATS